VGQALADSGIAREDVFVTTKCPPNRPGRELDTLRESLEQLQSEYVDLWLIHWPPDQGPGTDVWRAFIEARELGLAHDIGVSNYSTTQLDQLTEETGVAPAVNQIEWSPLLFDAAVLEEHRKRGIVLEGYSGLRGGVLENRTVLDIARQTRRTPAQVVIRWHLQHDIVVIPKSSRPDRIRSNADVGGFSLSDDQMAALDGLSGAG
jgi:2,5-diketo-D-gluconate reductase A